MNRPSITDPVWPFFCVLTGDLRATNLARGELMGENDTAMGLGQTFSLPAPLASTLLPGEKKAGCVGGLLALLLPMLPPSSESASSADVGCCRCCAPSDDAVVAMMTVIGEERCSPAPSSSLGAIKALARSPFARLKESPDSDLPSKEVVRRYRFRWSCSRLIGCMD